MHEVTLDDMIELLSDIKDNVDYETCTTLIDDRYLESLSMVSLVAELEDEFDITIPAVEVVAENFNSADAITALVERLAEDELD